MIFVLKPAAQFARAVARVGATLREHQFFGLGIGAPGLAEGFAGPLRKALFAFKPEAVEPFVAALAADPKTPAKLGEGPRG